MTQSKQMTPEDQERLLNTLHDIFEEYSDEEQWTEVSKALKLAGYLSPEQLKAEGWINPKQDEIDWLHRGGCRSA